MKRKIDIPTNMRGPRCTLPAVRCPGSVRLVLSLVASLVTLLATSVSADPEFSTSPDEVSAIQSAPGTAIAVWYANRPPDTIIRGIEETANVLAESGAFHVYGPRDLALAGGYTPLSTALRSASWLGVLRLSDRSAAWVAVGPTVEGSLIRYGTFRAKPENRIVGRLKRTLGSVLPERWQSPEQRFYRLVRHAMAEPGVDLSEIEREHVLPTTTLAGSKP